ncbi:Metallo-dependent hydrolase [Zopfia rhizophila CBS 207.26]|uniref:Metallo-dependent hydrolase n=1 Tax=Zopfia rhizophila CBS 207.26 TaxID=1314779 RepID=A0A6A6EAX6_9PEZI|nr:Metallo-dependent hydrolase [Zopfia rhizophila CBS 207.26]
MAEDAREEPFPWHLGIFDSHCHPTDTMASIPSISEMRARVLTIMATRGEDQDLVACVADKYGVKSSDQGKWEREECVVPCFGWHPWFSHQMYVSEGDGPGNGGAEGGNEAPRALQGEEKVRHYQSVLQARPVRVELSEEDRRLFLSLPNPQPFSQFLSQMRKNLEKYPFALVGEVGLDRSFRIPEPWSSEQEAQRNGELTAGGREGRRLSPFRVNPEHQKKLFKMQLQLAAEMGRAVSVHGVQAHGVLFDAIKELYEGHEKKVVNRKERRLRTRDHNYDEEESSDSSPKPYPPRICLHSYSGNRSIFGQYLNPTIPVEIFVSFSTAINLSDDLESENPRAFEEMVKSVPDHMLLIESDLHTAGERMDQRLEDIVRRVCKIKGWGLDEGAKRLATNWFRFVFGTGSKGA